VDSSATFLQSFSSQLDAQLFKGLIPAVMALRCMRRLQHTPRNLPFAFDMSDFDFGRRVSQVAKDLHENNRKAFPDDDFLFLSESFRGDAYKTMTLL
jgi:hypothetical protein